MFDEILPTSTICATSRVSSSVTRRPATNFGSLPSAFIFSVISGPPPWTSTTRMPDVVQEHHVPDRDLEHGGVDHRVAPELDHHDRAAELLDVRQGLGQDFDLPHVVYFPLIST